MSDHYPRLGHRTITAYNRLARDVAALNYLLRVKKPADNLGETGRRLLNDALRRANRIYVREPGVTAFRLFDPINPLTAADITLIVAQLTAAGFAFEARYDRLTRPAAGTFAR